MSSRETETLDLRHVGEVAAVVAKNADQVLAAPHCLDSPALTTYWTSSRRRADLWQYCLDDALEASRRDQPLGKHTVQSISTVISEVLATELVTRLWSAVLIGHERLHAKRQEPLARRVLNDHLTARRTSLRLLTHPIALPSSQIVALDRIRQRAERWTDCLLATLPEICSPEEFAFSNERFREFAEDTDVVTRLSTRFSGWHLLALSLRVASDGRADADQTRIQLHRDILDSIGGVIDAAETNRRFDSPGDTAALPPNETGGDDPHAIDGTPSLEAAVEEIDVFTQSEHLAADVEPIVSPMPSVEDPFLIDLAAENAPSLTSDEDVEAILYSNFNADSLDDDGSVSIPELLATPSDEPSEDKLHAVDESRISTDNVKRIETAPSVEPPQTDIVFKRIDSRRLRVESGGLVFHRVLDRSVH